MWEKYVFHALLFGEYHGWEDGIYSPYFPVKSEFPDEEAAFHVFLEKIVFSAEYPDGDWEVEAWSFFAYVRWCKIDRDTGGWKCKS